MGDVHLTHPGSIRRRLDVGSQTRVDEGGERIDRRSVTQQLSEGDPDAELTAQLGVDLGQEQ